MAAPALSFTASALRVSREGRLLIDDLSFALQPGEVLAVSGPSGCGKSTLLRALAWLDPSEGRLELDGRGPAELGAPAWRTRVRLVPQRIPGLLGSPRDTDAQIAAFAAQAGLERADAQALAAGFLLPAEAWDKPWSRLSGGEQQRALLALGLASPCDVLLLDEPTAALDPDASARVEAALEGRRAVIVTHDVAQAERLGTRSLQLDMAESGAGP